MKKLFNKRGITLIALVVTIVVLLIIAGTSISMLVGDNGIITKARMAALMTEFSTYKEEKELFDVNQGANNSNYSEESLNAGQTTLIYNTQQTPEGNIQTVIPSMEDKYAEKFEIIKGELLLWASTELEMEVATQLGIKLSPYIIIDGVLVSANENLDLQTTNGVVTLPERVTEIGAGAFSGVEGLKEIIIPSTVKVIHDNAFSFNAEIEKVTMQYGVEIIGNNVFTGCTSLREVIMPDSVISLGEEVFRNCSNLTTVQLSNNIEILEPLTFRGCTKLSTINIPQNLKSILNDVFNDCTSLDNIKIPAGVTNIDSTSFINCTSLYNLTIDSANQYYEIVDGIIYKKDMSSLIILATMSGEETVSIKEGIKVLGDGALSICTNMKTINLPSSLETISGNTFTGVSLLETINVSTGNQHFKAENGYLYSKDRKEIIYVVPTKTSISINSDVETIKTGSIMNKNITELTIPNNVINMEIYIFSNVTSLRSIKIGSGVANLSPSFKGWGGMPSDVNITIDSSNLNYKTEDNLILTKDGKKVLTYISNNVQSQTIPEGVEILEYNSFEDFQASEIILSNTLKEIGNNCFNLCPNLTEILIPNSVETIASNAFINCANLESIKIDNTAGSIIGAPWSAPKGDRVISWLK